MKQILVFLAFAIAVCTLAIEQVNANTPADSAANYKVKPKITVKVTKTNSDKNTSDSVYIPGYTDTSETGVTVESEASDTIYEDTDTYTFDDSEFNLGPEFFKEIGNAAGAAITISIITLLLVFGFPIFIILITFYFRYKTRRERYRLVEKAIAAGQPIPEGLFKESLNIDVQSKGIKNICLGIGLFIFLWALTDSFAMGCIGLLVMFTGIGQYLVARNQRSNNRDK